MKRLLYTLLVIGTATGAVAQTATQTTALKPLSEVVRSFETRGYIVHSAEDDGRTHEIEAMRPDGVRIEAVVDATTGEVLNERIDH